MKTFLRYWHILTHIGAEPYMSYIELKRVQMVNLMVFVSLPLMLFFSVVNVGQERFTLATLSFCTSLFLVLVVVLQYLGKYSLAKIILLLPSFCLFYFGALIYGNGGEYFLICILIVSMLLYESKKIQIGISTVVIMAVMSVHIFPDIDFYEERIPRDRVFFNIASSLVFIVVTVGFFKNIIYNNTKQIEAQRLKLHAMNRDKERVFSIIAHDMQSPMATLENMVGAWRQRIHSGYVPEKFIVRLQQQIVQQRAVLENLLEWSSSSMRGLHEHGSDVCIKELITDVVSFFELQYILKKLEFVVDIDSKDTAYADRKHLIIIFRNLISNAIKFSHVGGEIRINSSKDDTYLYVHIQDQGIGILPEKANMLFSTVQQRSIGTDDEPGAGLGLALCNELINLNKCTIHVESVPGRGSVFTIGLPRTG